jgi:hypothetical protein
MTRTIFIIFAPLSIIAFPWQFAAVIIFIASLYVPVIGISLGIVYDALYYTAGWPVGTLVGALCTVVAFFTARVIRSRISAVTL